MSANDGAAVHVKFGLGHCDEQKPALVPMDV